MTRTATHSQSPHPSAKPPLLPTETKESSEDSGISRYEVISTLESFMKITLAGFGGAMVGLSLSRRGASGRGVQSSTVQTVTSAASAARSPANNLKSLNTAKTDRLKFLKNATSKSAKGEESTKVARKSKDGRIRQYRPIRTTPPIVNPYRDRELPAAWAMACMVFAGIVEFSRALSPSSIVLELLPAESGSEDNSFVANANEDGGAQKYISSTENIFSLPLLSGGDMSVDKKLVTTSAITISDYMIGGAIAGAIFRGSAVRTHIGARVDASILGVPSVSGKKVGRPMAGIIPGAGLGLLAGFFVVVLDYAQVAVEKQFEENGSNEELDRLPLETQIKKEIPHDIKTMSNKELLKSIKNLKQGKAEK